MSFHNDSPFLIFLTLEVAHKGPLWHYRATFYHDLRGRSSNYKQKRKHFLKKTTEIPEVGRKTSPLRGVRFRFFAKNSDRDRIYRMKLQTLSRYNPLSVHGVLRNFFTLFFEILCLFWIFQPFLSICHIPRAHTRVYIMYAPCACKGGAGLAPIYGAGGADRRQVGEA